MTDPHPRSRVEFLDPHRLRLAESRTPWVSPAEVRAVDRLWEETVARRPHHFDGPLVACLRLERQERGLLLSWARSTYRYRALRRIRAAGERVPSSVFVTVLQPTRTGELVVGRGSASTAAPGRWQLPGGSAEPPPEGEPLDLDLLRRHAARELAEETGVEAPPGELSLWGVTRGARGNIGFHFLAAQRPAPLLRARFAAAAASERAAGREPELDRIALVRAGAGPAELGGPCVDYLDAVLRRHARREAT
ncbi:NUDIX domain-containing protein [Streptomyces sp. NPDC006512]|uniref:NUDIX domain-containing protein n=1 Tax=Streptomyces sp. NPDC006512 TaxID=3154307 RepID=UPI0033BD1484